MGLAPLLRELELAEEYQELRHQFLEATGYGPSDILSVSYLNRIFMTRNGGEYRIKEDGSIERLAGPPADVEDRYEE